LPSSNVAKSPSAGYLGLTFDPDKGHVTRNNYSSTVNLTNLERQVFGLLLRNHDSVVNLRLLLAIWGNKLDAKPTLYTTIKRMNDKLSPLDVWADNHRSQGYALMGTAMTSAAS
jgi:DNA-binding response OmpR family regulator